MGILELRQGFPLSSIGEVTYERIQSPGLLLINVCTLN